MSDTANPSRAVGPVHRAFGLLQLVVDAGEPVGVRELARRSGMSRSTTGRMLGILAELGMVERTVDGAATSGAALATLTASVGQSAAVFRERFRPLTTELMEAFGENAAVGVDDGDGFLYIASARLDSAVQVPDPVGGRFDFHVIAPGLVAMSAWSEDRLAGYLERELSIATDHSVIEPRRVRDRLDQSRSDGFIWTDQELDLEVNGLAVPINSTDGVLIAVATLYGPAYRLNRESSPTLGSSLAAFVAERALAIS